MWETERRRFTSARCSRGYLGRSYSSTPGARQAPWPEVRRRRYCAAAPDRGPEILGVAVWECRFWEADAIPSGAEKGTGDRDGALADPSDLLTCYGYGVMEVVDGFASGRVMVHDRVAVVEAVLGDGRKVRGGIERGVWVLLAEGSGQMREVRTIGADGRVLQRIRLEQ